MSKTGKTGRKSHSAPKPNNARKSGIDGLKPEKSGCKTPQVMRLVEQNKNAVNPVILAGKSRIPQQLRGREPLSRIMRRGLGEEFSDADGTVVVNLTELAIGYEAPEILDRFNACSCSKCLEVFSKRISEKVPARFARINKNSQRFGSRELKERMEPVRKIVLSEMIRELIGNKKRCFHDE